VVGVRGVSMREDVPEQVSQSMEMLGRMPAVLTALCGGLSEVWAERNEGEGTWTVAEVIGHLVHTERVNWMPRIRMVLESGEERMFAPLDRAAHLGEERATLEAEIAAFTRLREGNLEELRALRLIGADLERRGVHPALGQVTVGELLATWTTHDLTHLHQIARILAWQNREAVGPFRKFLGVLQCDGHSRPA
jgi:uncharacterized damage-inducible protein DinB